MSSELDSRNEVVDQQQAAEALTARRSLATNERFLEGLRIGLVAVKEVAGQRDEVLLRLEEKKAECAALRAELGGRMEELQRLSNRALQITRTQARIGKWGDSCPAVKAANASAYAWGDQAAVKAACDKLREEYEEFCKEAVGHGFDRELADVAIVVFRLAHLRGFDLLDAIEAKMLEVVAKHGGVWMDRDGKEHGK